MSRSATGKQPDGATRREHEPPKVSSGCVTNSRTVITVISARSRGPADHAAGPVYRRARRRRPTAAPGDVVRHLPTPGGIRHRDAEDAHSGPGASQLGPQPAHVHVDNPSSACSVAPGASTSCSSSRPPGMLGKQRQQSKTPCGSGPLGHRHRRDAGHLVDEEAERVVLRIPFSRREASADPGQQLGERVRLVR